MIILLGQATCVRLAARIKRNLSAKFEVWEVTRFRNISERSFVSKRTFGGKTTRAHCAERGVVSGVEISFVRVHF